jgi:gliding motility-associated-like protein
MIFNPDKAKWLRVSTVFAFILFAVSLKIFGSGGNWERLTLLKGAFQTSEDPVADFSFSPNGVCASEPIKFTNLSTGEELSYEWDFKDGAKSTLKDPSHTFSTATGNGTRTFAVTLTVKDKSGVTKTVTKNIIVKETPSLKVTSEQEVTTFENLQYFIVCENQPSEFTFYNAKEANENNIRYQIDWGDGSQPFDAANWDMLKHSYDVGIYNITYTVTPANGCKVTKKYGVFIGSNPAVGLGNPGNTNVCVGEQLTFPITGTENNPEGTIYTVTFSDGSAPQTFVHPPPASVSHIFTTGSCGESADGFNNSFSVKILAENPCSISQASVVPIYVSEPPIPEIKVSSPTVCVDETIIITNITDFKTEVSANGSCNENKRFVWEISPATGWTLATGNSLGSRPNPNSPNSWISGSDVLRPKFTTPGTYTIKLFTGNRCGLKEESTIITVIPKPEPSFTLPSAEICGPATVKATNTSNILGLGGTGAYNWSVSYSNSSCGTSSDWNFEPGSDKNSESPVFKFNKPGTYTITLAIAASCGTFRQEQKITVTAPPSVTLAPVPLTCGPTSFTPTANVTACGTDTPTYKWTFEGGTPATSTSLDPGVVSFNTSGPKKITLEVTTSCGTTKVEKSFSVANPPKIDMGADSEICAGEEKELRAVVTEGSGKYSYSWTSSPSSSIPGSNSPNIKVKPSATTTYTLTVTDQETLCKTSDQVKVTVIPAPTIQFSLPDQEICSGETIQPVMISTTPSGETVSWTAESGGVDGVQGSGTDQIPAQTLINKSGKQLKVVYTAAVENSTAGNCTVIPARYTITVNPEPAYQDEQLSVCSGEEINFKPKGTVAGSTFQWSVVAPAGISGANNSNKPESALIQKLVNDTNAPIDVVFTLTPSIGACTGDSFQLKVSVQPSPSMTFSENDQVLCTGSSSKAVTISSDVPSATFSWTADPKGVLGVVASGSTGVIPAQNLINPTSSPITIEYQVNVKTNAGDSCSGAPRSYKITVNPSITLAEAPSDYNGSGISCFGSNDGFIKLIVSGGNGVYQFAWKGPNGFITSEKDLDNLKPGNYEVTVSDDYGCTVSRSFEITEPAALSASVGSTKDVLCAGDETGVVELIVAGGVSTRPYSFEWKRNGVLFNSTDQNLSEIPAGTYEVTVRDANGCETRIEGIQITEPAAPIFINYTKKDISCYGANDGSLDLDVSGGLPPYDIKWTFGSTQSGFTNLGPGDYTLTVADQSGCIRTQTITIEDAPIFKIEPEVQHILCFGDKNGSIKLNLTGGVGQTTIRWDHGQELENLFNLTAGFYAVTIKDQTDCEIRSEFNIVEPAPLLLEPSVADALDCDNPQSGAIDLAISGGTPPYRIDWSNGMSGASLSGIPAGQYAVTIADASGCIINEVLEVKRPPQLSITAFQSANVVCEPRKVEHIVQITVSGGIAPYSISWSGGTVSVDEKTMTTTESGFYEVTVVDGKGCTTSQSFNIENTDLIADSEIKSAVFDQYNSYLVNFEIQFWNRSFGQIAAYHWDFGDGSESFEENPKHTYAAEGEYEILLTVTDILGCSAEVRKKIHVFDYFLVVPNIFTPNGDGINDYFFPRFVGIESIEFWVLNKWGETIFHTKDLDSQGWDGRLNDEVPIPGNYVYRVRFKTLDGRTQTLTDLFMLLK